MSDEARDAVSTLLLRALLAALAPLHAAHVATERAGWRRTSAALRVLWVRGSMLAGDLGGLRARDVDGGAR